MPYSAVFERILWKYGPWISLVGVVVMAVIAPKRDFAAWILTFAGLLFAGQRAWRGRMLDALLQLHADEGSSEQGKAKRLIAEALKQSDEKNPYKRAREHLDSLKSRNDAEAFNEFDDARRRLAHFWLRAVKLVHWGVLSEKDLFDNFEPDILEKLEAFETIVAEDYRDLAEPKQYLAMELFIAWLNQLGESEKAKVLKPTLPARPRLYRQYRESLRKDVTE